MADRVLFCQRGKVCYHISLCKERTLRELRFLFSGEHYAKTKQSASLPYIVKGHRSPLIRRLYGVDLALQYNKVQNLKIASHNIDGICIQPGEVFSFWKVVGPVNRRKGYLDGLTIGKDGPSSGIGGGLCQLANMIHWLVLNSPLTVTELHHHSDALFPDERRRVPFGTGTSVFYNNIDYQFKNTTDQPVQLRLWLDANDLCGELRSRRPFSTRYKIVEENHHFVREGEQYFRISQVYRLVYDRESKRQLAKELVLDNHSKVLYDPALIPPDQLQNV